MLVLKAYFISYEFGNNYSMGNSFKSYHISYKHREYAFLIIINSHFNFF